MALEIQPMNLGEGEADTSFMVWSMTPTVTPSASTQMLRVCFPVTFMGALISRFAMQRT